MSFSDATLIPVSCCDLCALETELLMEACTTVPPAVVGAAADLELVCVDNSPYAQGLAVIVGDIVDGFTFYCCGQVLQP